MAACSAGSSKSGAQEVVYFDQVVTIPAKAAGAVAAPTATATGAGNVDSGYHWYAVAAVNAAGQESYLSAGGLVLCAGAKSIDVTDIPAGPTGTTKLRLYRTKHAGGVEDFETVRFYLVAELSATPPASYTDNVADSTLPADYIFAHALRFDHIIPPSMS